LSQKEEIKTPGVTLSAYTKSAASARSPKVNDLILKSGNLDKKLWYGSLTDFILIYWKFCSSLNSGIAIILVQNKLQNFKHFLKTDIKNSWKKPGMVNNFLRFLIPQIVQLSINIYYLNFTLSSVTIRLMQCYTEKNFFFNLNQISKMKNYIWFILTHIYHSSQKFSMACYDIWLRLNNMCGLSWFKPYFDVCIFNILLIWFKLKKIFFSV
jgi:hypothetical protein